MLLADQDVVNAAVAVSDALTAVTGAYSQPQMLPWGKTVGDSRAARAAADTALQAALGELIVVAREQLHPTPPPSWWFRAVRWSRQLVPGACRRAAITATVPAQRTGDDTAAVTTGTPVLLAPSTR